MGIATPRGRGQATTDQPQKAQDAMEREGDRRCAAHHGRMTKHYAVGKQPDTWRARRWHKRGCGTHATCGGRKCTAPTVLGVREECGKPSG